MAELLTDTLAAFLRREAARPFVVGHADCALFVADWVAIVTGSDPAAALRGTYGSPADAAALHGRRGLAGTVGRCLALAGLRMTRRPDPGDVAVLHAAGEFYCGIRTGRGWMVRADRAVMCIAAPRVIAAWRLPASCREVRHG